MNIKLIAIMLSFSTLVACGGGADTPASATSSSGSVAAGQSVTLSAGQTVLAPAGATVRTPDGSSVTLNGDKNTVNTTAGAVVTVPASATGPADNTIVAR